MDRTLVELRVLQDTLNRRDRLIEQVDAQLLKLRPRDRRVEVDVVFSRSTSIDALDDMFLFARSHALRRRQTARVPDGVLLVLPLELVDEVRHHHAVKVLPAMVRVPRRRLEHKDVSPIVRRDIINVPHPRSKVRMVFHKTSPCQALTQSLPPWSS